MAAWTSTQCLLCGEIWPDMTLTGDSCATPTRVWAWRAGSQRFPGSSPSEESGAEPCSPGHSLGALICRKVHSDTQEETIGDGVYMDTKL